MYTMFATFSLHANDMIPKIHELYRFNEWWSFFFLILYVLFLQFTFMNLFTSIFFEEQRLFTIYEDAIYTKYPHLRRTGIIKQWLMGSLICCKGYLQRRKMRGKGNQKQEAKEDMSGVNTFKDKMKQEKRKRQLQRQNSRM